MRKRIRVAIYGTGSWANRTHIPNLRKVDDVEIVAACDTDRAALGTTAANHGIPSIYEDGLEMLRKERIDVLYSVVPAYARTNVEVTAARMGIHLFSEKPQALRMSVALSIDRAIRESGVLSTVCFRERYRPFFQRARDLLRGKRVVHARFQSLGGLPSAPGSSDRARWWSDFEKSGGSALDWGVHAVDYIRFMTGLQVERAQAYYCHHPAYPFPLGCSFHLGLEGGAIAALTFLSTGRSAWGQNPWFTIHYEGGVLSLFGYERIEQDGITVYRGSEFDPWLEQTRVFLQAVRTGDPGILLNDYHDGLYSLAPVLAGWESSRRGGETIRIADYLRDDGRE